MNLMDNSKFIYEDDEIIVIMREDRKENGELLLTTKKHFDNLFEIDEDLLGHIHKVLKDIKDLIYDRLAPDGIQITSNYGSINSYNAFYLDIIPYYNPTQPLVDINIIYDKLK